MFKSPVLTWELVQYIPQKQIGREIKPDHKTIGRGTAGDS